MFQGYDIKQNKDHTDKLRFNVFLVSTIVIHYVVYLLFITTCYQLFFFILNYYYYNL